MKKIFLITLAGAFAVGLNAQDLSLFEPPEEILPEEFITIAVPIFGGAGATIDLATGRVRVCPGFALRKCGMVIIRFFGSAMQDFDQLQYIDSEVAVLDQHGRVTRVLSACDTDLDVFQVVESELLQLNDFDRRVLRASQTITMFDGD